MSGPNGYSLTAYGRMVTDSPRMEAYERALATCIQPGDTLVDLGAGPGVFSLLGCRHGAANVHAIEPDGAIELLGPMAAANGWSDRIHCHPTISTRVSLDQPADVVVADLRGVLPTFQHHIAAMIDARSRLLAPDGHLIPARDRLFAALVSAETEYRGFSQPWRDNELELDLHAGLRQAINSNKRVCLNADCLLVGPGQWAELDYRTIDSSDIAGRLQWRAERAGTAHGVLVWFDAELAEGIGFSNAPGQPESVYGQMFFPLEDAVAIRPGDRVELDLHANLVEGDYVYRWQTRIASPDSDRPDKADFRQSNFYATTLSPAALRMRDARATPGLAFNGQVQRFVLQRLDGQTTLEAIARELAAAYPDEFISWKQALAHVASAAVKFGDYSEQPAAQE